MATPGATPDSSPSPLGVASPAVVTAANLERDPLKKNHRNFLWKTWMTWFNNPPTDLMYDVWDRLHHGPDKDIEMGYRGLSKSYIMVTFGCEQHYCDPELLLLNLAGSGQAAKGNAALYWGMIHGFDWLTHMRPRGHDRASTTAFDINGSKHEKSESYASLAIFSGDKTGRRADLITPDDIETPTTAESESLRAALRAHLAEATGAILRPGGRVKMLGTPQVEDTIYLHLVMEKGYGMRIWPVLYPSPEEMLHYGPWLAPRIKAALEANPHLVGTSTEPTRFSDDEIKARQLEYGTQEFKRQFLLWTDVGGLETKPLKLRDCIVVDIPVPTASSPLKVPSDIQWSPYPESIVQGIEVDSLTGDSQMFFPMMTDAFRNFWQKPESVIIQVDPSGQGKDEATWGALAEHAARVFLLDVEASLEGYSKETLRAIAMMAKRWGASKIKIEKNYGGGMFGELLRPHLADIGYGCTIEEEFATGVKEIRILDTLEALIGDHRLVVNLQVLKRDYHVGYTTVEDAKKRTYRFTYQLTRITREKGCLAHDDRIDMVASGVRSFMGKLRRSLISASEAAKEMEWNAEVDAMIAQQREALGSDQPGSSPKGRRIGGILKDVGGVIGSALFRGRRR